MYVCLTCHVSVLLLQGNWIHFFVFYQEFENSLQLFEPRVEAIQKQARNIPATSKSGQVQTRLNLMVDKWDHLWALSHIYVERYNTGIISEVISRKNMWSYIEHFVLAIFNIE